MRLLTNFLGMPLHMGILSAFVFFLLRTVAFFAMFSGEEPFNAMGIELGPDEQVGLAALALAGVPISILAGFGSLFHIEIHLRFLVTLLLATLVVDTVWIMVSFIMGDICSSLVDNYLLRRGPIFICLSIGLAAVFWRSAILLFEVYVTYAAWSVAERLRLNEFPELLSYDGAGKPGGVDYGGARDPDL
mmetsp:Transcript_112255/g.349803  ORF Transcript_112255/g.349803 Transcript_112255/m.349803 type:complete len:189 (+) Transcript_112255:105-671(+)|eukprot:CAMPEP_0204523154 /NCGR_PEP_ID=MMETSP0661-20131031/6699_1 /ASSEMBLY_ACC=CAM_ASM_000606 /TAXON_ID=109239 /ORGANISM="Alexandrium margalefi, Strain AMGDE01CS-322" /LENGTH=188 /DNA_ID=CAMNT_0051528853 /DNA_START=99 /DNA_END=665 /DNA_ORIENTATION=-